MSAPGLPGRQLRRAPGRLQAALELVAELVDRDAVLGERVAVAHGDRAVLERLVVDRHAVGRADLVLAAEAAAEGDAPGRVRLPAPPPRLRGLAPELGPPLPLPHGRSPRP